MVASAQPITADRSGTGPAVVAPLAATGFALTAPKSVNTGKRFRVSGSVARSFANAVAVVEVRSGRTWVPINRGKVSSTGRISLRPQLSEPGKHTLRVRVTTGRATARSASVTVTANGKAVTSESPLRMLAHVYSQTDAPPGRSLAARAEGDDVAGTAAAAAASDEALSVKSVASFLGEGAVGAVEGFGVNLLLGLIFPGSSAATGAQIEQLKEEIQTGFDNVYADLAQLQDSVDQVQTQNSEIFAEASLAACDTLLTAMNADAQVIQDAFANYQDVLTEDWGEANLTYSGGVGNALAIGNYVFGVGSNSEPSFGPGVNRVEVAVNSILSAFTQQGPQNVISTCADGLAGYVIQQELGAVTSPTQQVPIGTLDTAYAQLMQDLVGEYAATINIGLALVGTGDLLAATTFVVGPTGDSDVTTVPQFLSACQQLDLFSCPATAEQIATGQDGVSQLWHAAGASWGQVTNGMLQSDLYAYAGQTTFSNGTNAWLPDITSFQQGTFGLPPQAGPPISSTNVDPANPVAGVTGLAEGSWGPLNFSPASSAAFNGIIRTDQYTQPYPGAQQSNILAACGGPSLTNCSGTTRLGDYLGNAGLLNGGASISSDDILILYTGESYVWYPQYSAASAGFGYMGKNQGFNWNQPWIFQLLTASFLDTGMLPNLGVSTVVNDPATFDFITGQGTVGNFTLGDVYPFATKADNASASAGKSVATSLTLQNYSNGYNFVAIPCSSWSTSEYAQYGGNWTVMNWLAPGNGSTNNYGDGCGQTSYFPGGGAVPASSGRTTQLSASTTALADFYTQPVLNAVLETSEFGQPDYTVNSCETPVTDGAPCQSTYWQGWDELPGFVTAITTNADESPDAPPWTPVTPAGQEQYLWPVIPTSDDSLAVACPTINGVTSNVTSFSQGTTDVGIPQTCLQLFDEWLAVTAGQTIGPVSILIGPQTGQPGGGNAAEVSFLNDDTAPVTVSAGFSGSAGASVAAGITGEGVGACTAESEGGVDGYVCQITISGSGVTEVTVPLTFTGDDTTADLAVVAASGQPHYLASTKAQVTTATAPVAAIPFGVTGLAASFDPASLNAAGGGTVTLTWNQPYATSPIASYVVTAMGPTGSAPVDDTIPVSQVTVQSNGQLSTTVNIAQGGSWTFTVAAAANAGVGRADTLTAYLGQAPPEPPRNVTGRELTNGQVALSWQPGLASPPISAYTVTWWSGTSTTPPASATGLVPGPEWVSTGAGSSMVGAVTVTDTRYFVPSLPTTGPWTFQVTATNSLGTSTPSTTMVNLQGFAPSRPLSLGVDVLPTGAVNADWSASPFGVPAPTSYTVGLYAPTTCTTDDSCTTPLLSSASVDASGSRGPSAVFDLFTLGANSSPGVYTVAVYATNALGDGATTRSTVLITQAFIKRLTAAQDAVDTSRASMSKSIEDLNTLECKRGLLTGSACSST